MLLKDGDGKSWIERWVFGMEDGDDGLVLRDGEKRVVFRER